MEVMIEDVPDGDWFCEECRTEVAIEEKYKKTRNISTKDWHGVFKKKGIENVSVTNGSIKKQREVIFSIKLKMLLNIYNSVHLTILIDCLLKVVDMFSSLIEVHLQFWIILLKYFYTLQLKSCGDVGDQEKLAVCSRCTDGTEHM
jgi:hypothetical protein